MYVESFHLETCAELGKRLRDGLQQLFATQLLFWYFQTYFVHIGLGHLKSRSCSMKQNVSSDQAALILDPYGTVQGCQTALLIAKMGYILSVLTQKNLTWLYDYIWVTCLPSFIQQKVETCG